ncbi:MULTISPECIES: hypothetical protein [unclassified Polaromonas]|uniref:hypothetical protein n=1 Tax=unclassified Polaromonas TaxID=2638319 RepID=UPI0018CB7616|nr:MULTISPECIES: hypothetical protein [unclassified Polaromonas]MBG6072598.1 hypothetical protein [Polaromonas sp. CG_9.7]MBG6114682.1 hypothetical protein [Polaromonas sp. CG_9.2]MDH6185153.1 hypothetical protein [Polaromonas sp. CG_23.6]
MTASQTPPANDFVRWVEEKSDTVMADLGDKFPPATSGLDALHAETYTQRIEEVLLGHEPPDEALLEELAALEDAPPLSDEELDRQALESGGADADPATPE